MDVEIFEKALAAKLLKELDYPDNWSNQTLTSIKHKVKNYYILMHVHSREVTLISPQQYAFVNRKLSAEIFLKAHEIFKNAEAIIKVQKEKEAMQKLIEAFGLEDRATKLKALEEISKTMPDPIPVVKKVVEVEPTKPAEPEQIEADFKLPEKKKKFWSKFF